ncbi:hypothetical protein CC78DRAFT_584794 [Lojkania enalia]|uniref:Uncharacterized protein n=1 Tax=Lojkania enalia TaxID=147567 RepID=A0A9P4K452_9PLEO|nr:hypothetical protein CC78DRAFT_584794 [Didymosphaeria enalia]
MCTVVNWGPHIRSSDLQQSWNWHALSGYHYKARQQEQQIASGKEEGMDSLMRVFGTSIWPSPVLEHIEAVRFAVAKGFFGGAASASLRLSQPVPRNFFYHCVACWAVINATVPRLKSVGASRVVCEARPASMRLRALQSFQLKRQSTYRSPPPVPVQQASSRSPARVRRRPVRSAHHWRTTQHHPPSPPARPVTTIHPFLRPSPLPSLLALSAPRLPPHLLPTCFEPASPPLRFAASPQRAHDSDPSLVPPTDNRIFAFFTPRRIDILETFGSSFRNATHSGQRHHKHPRSPS